MNSVAFICPLYDMKNHFDLAINLYKSKIDYDIQADLIFIFSNEEQKNKFELRVKNELGVDDMIYNIMPEDLSSYKAQAVTKKLYGLKEFMNQYDYIVLVDCESIFVKKFDAGQLAEEIWNSKGMLASNISPSGFFIMRTCYKTMGLYYNKKLRKSLGTYKYNFWFNELQVYKCTYLSGFFEWLSRFDIEKIYNTWHCFEYYVFYAYLCLEHDFAAKKYKYICNGGINECIEIFNIKKQIKILADMNLHWTSSREIMSDNIVMKFHLDRDVTSSDYGENKAANPVVLIKQMLKRYIVMFLEIPEKIKCKYFDSESIG